MCGESCVAIQAVPAVFRLTDMPFQEHSELLRRVTTSFHFSAVTLGRFWQ